MKIINLLNKIANGEEVPNKIRIDHWCYEFEWVEYLENYYDKSADLDLMSVLSMSKEELNYEVKIIEEKIEIIEDKQIETVNDFTANVGTVDESNVEEYIHILFEQETILYFKINEIIDKLNKLEEGKK